MSLVECARQSREEELRARLRRSLAIRALVAMGRTQGQVARDLGITQPAVSQALRASQRAAHEPLAELMDAAAPVVKELAASRGFTDVAVAGSGERGEVQPSPGIHIIVRAPQDMPAADLTWLQDTLRTVLCHPVAVGVYDALQPGAGDDSHRGTVLL